MSKRFNQGKETLDDLMNNYRHLTIRFEFKNEKEQELEVVELKYYKKLIEEIEKQQKIINDMAEQLTTPTHNKEWVIYHFTNKYEEGKGN